MYFREKRLRDVKPITSTVPRSESKTLSTLAYAFTALRFTYFFSFTFSTNDITFGSSSKVPTTRRPPTFFVVVRLSILSGLSILTVILSCQLQRGPREGKIINLPAGTESKSVFYSMFVETMRPVHRGRFV